MRGDEILLLGIGIQPPWELVDQHLDTTTQPHEGTSQNRPILRQLLSS